MRTILISTALVFFITGIVYTQIPQTINYQGRLTDESSQPVADGEYQISFTIYDAPDMAGGTALWTSAFQTVAVYDGLFSYQLGSNAHLPHDLFATDTVRWLGITVSQDEPEISPRTRLISTPYAYQALRADTAEYAISGGEGGWAAEGQVIALADTTSSVGIGTVDPGNHKLYVKSSDSGDPGATVFVKNSIPENLGMIVENDSYDVSLLISQAGQGDIFRCNSYTGGLHPVFMISGDGSTSTVGDPQFLSSMTVYGELSGCDSALTVNCDGVRIGDNEPPTVDNLLTIERAYHTPDYRHGIDLSITNADVGSLYGITSSVHNTYALSGASCYGIYSLAKNDGIRYGLYCRAEPETFLPREGWSYGLYTSGYGGEYAYGIYASADGADENWAGWFVGDVNITGTLYGGKASVKIDHPLDPENMFLNHNLIESPDMMTVYNGNVILDNNGESLVELPEYFEALNSDFRYQLTCIGGFAPVYIAQKIENNNFTIAGGEPGLEVSWQVTGIRKDQFAEANRGRVEVDKRENEKGFYLHPEVFGLGQDNYIHHEQIQNAGLMTK